MIEVAEQLLFGNDDLDTPSCSGYLPLVDIVFATCYGVWSRDDILSCAGLDGVITVRIDLQKVRQTLQEVQRHVHAHHCHHFAVTVMYRTRAADHHCPCSCIIQIGLAPPTAVILKAVLIPLHLRVVVGGTAYLTGEDTILRNAATAHFVEISLLGIIIGHKGDSHTRVLA